jgi:hypothetical protein
MAKRAERSRFESILKSGFAEKEPTSLVPDLLSIAVGIDLASSAELFLGSEIGLPDRGGAHEPLRDLTISFGKLTLALSFSVFSGLDHIKACQTQTVRTDIQLLIPIFSIFDDFYSCLDRNRIQFRP